MAKPDPLRVAVVGAGAVGGFFGAHLVEAGHDVVFCVRRPFDRIVVESATAPVDRTAVCLVDPSGASAVDLVVLAVKAGDTGSVASWFAALCGASTTVAVLQNGVDHVARVSPFVRAQMIVPAVVYVSAELVAPGHVRHDTNRRLVVPADEGGRRLVAAYEGSAIEVSLSAEWKTEAWRKLCANVSINALTALTRSSADILHRPDIAEIALVLMRECTAVANAEGAHLADDTPEQVLTRQRALPAHSRSSMLYDVLAGRPLEHDALHGAVLRGGQRHGIATPTTAIIHALLDTLSSSPAG